MANTPILRTRLKRADVDALAALYHADAINHQVVQSPVRGLEAIRAIPKNLFQDGEWAILEWRDPLGLRGCGFFHVVDDQIRFQRGYWDKRSFLRMHRLPISEP